MATVSEKVKAALAAIDAAAKALSAVDADIAEANAAAGVRDIRLNEVAEAETRLARIREETAQADTEFARWREVTAKQQATGNARIDQLRADLQALEEQVAERRAEHDSVVGGIAALSQRLKL
jgi:hypothetical protein